VNEIVEKLGLSRGSVRTVIHKDLQFKYASVIGAKRIVAKRNDVSRRMPNCRRLTRQMEPNEAWYLD
jgi:hypothetical protein